MSVSHSTRIRFTLLGAIALTSFAAACADAPTAPTATSPVAANQSLIGTLTNTLTNTLTDVEGLLWLTPVTQATASQVIGPEGGSLSIPNGIKLTVPKGAVSTNVTFSVTRLPGLIVAYDFQPHGMKFAVPLIIEQPTQGTNLLNLNATSKVEGAYFLGTSALDELLGIAKVAEFEPTIVSSDKAWVRFTVQHFSGYMISVGREQGDQ